MKNLKLLNFVTHTFPNLENIQIASQISSSEHEFLVAHNLKVSKIDVKNQSSSLLFDVSDFFPDLEVSIINLGYFIIERVIVCGISNGSVVKYNLETSQADVEEVFPNRIKAQKLSPDNELIVFVTSDQSVILTDYRLEILNSSSLLEDSFGQGEFINVGWGKKETQFHGSEGKEAAKRTVTFQEVDSADDGNSESIITWRGDSALFAVGYFCKSICMFKVYDREGILQYTSEKQPGLGCYFAWKPSGNLIATTQNLPNKYVVAFFEKNGLKHGELTLPFQKCDVEMMGLSWSSDSEVLCVWCKDLSTRKSFIYLYTVNNYHWYLKHSVVFTTDISSILWDETGHLASGKDLNIYFTNGKYMCYKWAWVVDKSRGTTPQDNALVGVIDGSKLLLTSFRKSVIPPPMAGWTVTCDSSINCVTFGPAYSISSVDTNHFALLHADHTLSVHKLNSNNNVEKLWEESLEKHLKQANENISDVITQLIWLSTDVIIAVYNSGDKSNLLNIKLSADSIDSVKIIPTHEVFIGICAFGNNEEVLLQTMSGKLMVYSVLSGNITNHSFSFPKACYEMDVSCYENIKNVYGLCPRSRFYVNGQEVASVNSFFIHSEFLLLTTLSHHLLCCPLSKDIETVLINYGNTKDQSNSCLASRKLERGSKLVTAVSCDSRVVLQLPRGNIETIQPRALSIKIIGNNLDNCQYFEAIDVMRKQRINLNLLYDHDPQKFYENIEVFMKQINNTSWLSLFISDLEDNDVTTTMYSTSYSARDNEIKRTGKVKSVCEKIRNVLEKLNENNRYLLPIITTFVKTGDINDLENALLLIKRINNEQKKSLVSADEALRYLLYMVDVNKLYDIALGLYDFELVMFVASKSQKDPKEYVPFLNNLKNMNENYRRFTIDDLLKKHNSALKHLMLYGDDKENEILTYIKKHTLYKTALKCVNTDDTMYLKVMECYGNYLMSHRNFKEAGIVFMRCGHLEQALNAFVEAAEWNMAIHVLESLPREQSVMEQTQRKLLMCLKERRQYSDALDLSLYCGNMSVEELVELCFEGRMFTKVIGVCAKLKSLQVIDTCVEPAALEQYKSILLTVHQNEEQFIKQKCRLSVVRKNKKEREELGEEGLDDCDLYSDTSSMMTSLGSRSSSRTFRSSKNKRKHERKLMSLKEGSKFEDIALIKSLYTNITNTFALRKDVGDLCLLLQWLGKDQEVCDIQNSLENVLSQMNNSLVEIWTQDLLTTKTSNEANTLDTQEIPDSNVFLEPHLRIAPVLQPLNWKVHSLI